MTLSNIPFAIDGALISSALLRKGLYAALGGLGGVVGINDLKVSATVPNGQSLNVASGVGVVLNGYQTSPNEVYIASNPGVHLISSGDMPPSSPGTTYWMVCLVVGDPQAGYSQTGHPFMPSDFDPGQANTFQYVRPVILPCSSSDTTFAQLGKPYPGLALARLAIPASTTTITDAMITDLRVRANSKGRWDRVNTADLTLTNAQAATDIPGLSETIPVTGPGDVFDIDISADVYITGTPVVNFVDLAVDGVLQGASIISSGTGHINGYSMWTITGLSAGNHTFKAISSNLAGSTGTALLSTGVAKLRIRRG